jgi:hypothetical protein
MNKLLFLGVVALNINQAWAAFSIDLTTPSLNSTSYTKATSTQHTIYAEYAQNGTPPNNMVVGSLSSGATMHLKVLLPPGTKQAVIRGESNDWIGATGKQPVVGVVNQDITGACPSTSDGITFSCNGVMLAPPSGGLSSQLYSGTELTLPQYAHFILHNPSSTSFTFTTLTISIQITNTSAYTSWLNSRPWAGGASTNSVDGIGDTTVVTPITTPQCDITDANLLSTLDGVLAIGLPRVKYLGGSFADMRMQLKLDPNSPPGRLLFRLENLQFLTCGQTLSK